MGVQCREGVSRGPDHQSQSPCIGGECSRVGTEPIEREPDGQYECTVTEHLSTDVGTDFGRKAAITEDRLYPVNPGRQGPICFAEHGRLLVD